MKSCRFMILLLAALLPLSCVEEELLPTGQSHRQNVPAAETTGEDGLVRDDRGHWIARNRRVPLVGAGRTINDLSPALVEVLSADKGLNCVTDLNIDNCADFSGIGVNLLGTQIISVKDMYRTYAPGQKVGFVLGNNEKSILTADVLSFFVIQLYNDGEPAGRFELGASDGETLNLNVLKLTSTGNTGRQVIEVTAEEPFDEIALCTTGIEGDIGQNNLGVYYAFVGETPEEDIYSADGATIKEGIVKWTNVVGDAENLLDPDSDEGVLVYETITGLWPVHYLTVDFGSDAYFKEGTELGFKYTQGSLLSLKLFSSVSLTAYDSGWDSTGDEFETSSLLGLSAISGNQGAYSLVTTNDRAKGLRIYWAGINVDAGALVLDRVYKRDPIVIDPTSYFTAPEHVTVSKSSYSFMRPLADASGKTATVNLSIVESDGSVYVDESGYGIGGLKEGASCTVRAEVAVPGSGSFVTETVVEREPADDAVPPVYMIEREGFGLEGALSPGGITVISGMENPGYITDNDINNSAVCVKAISLVDMSRIVSIVKTDGEYANPDGREVRVGFTLQANSELLSLQALDFFRIYLYRDGQKVETKVPAENNSVSLGLLGGSNKMCVSVLTDQPFDQVVLETAGVASVRLGSLKIYYGFYEETHGDYSEDAGIADWCTEIMSAASHGMWLDFDKSAFNVASVATFLTDMSNIIDADKNTSALVSALLGVGTVKVDVHFDPVRTNQWIGMIVRFPDGIITADILSRCKMTLYSQGTEVETLVYKDLSLLDLQLIGFGDKTYIEAYPRTGSHVDEIELEMGGITVGSNVEIFGVYMRPDENMNGIPDCSEDEETDNPDNMFANPDEYHVCDGSDLVISVQGGVADEDYDLLFENIDNPESPVQLENVRMSESRKFSIGSGTLDAGRYILSIQPSSGKDAGSSYPENVQVFIHPRKTTWTGAVSHDWNEWTNWKEGTPWSCTDVLIPAGCGRYPVLTGAEDENACCNNIQFGNGAEVAGTHNLTYSRAWVNFTLDNGEYNMFSSPLKETYTGDMFVTSYRGSAVPSELDYTWCWLQYGESTCPEGVNRFEPEIYQRVWNRSVQNSTSEGHEDVDLDSSLWSSTYNLVADPYEAGKGVLVRPYTEGTGAGEVSQFCLPKDYTEYEYYDMATEEFTGRRDAVERTAGYSGRFIYEDADGMASFPLHVLLENERPSNMYLAGNPFICHISLEKFFEYNPAVSEVRFLQKDAGGSYGYRTVARTAAAGETVAPLGGFIVKVGGIYEETARFKLYIHFTDDMMTVTGSL